MSQPLTEALEPVNALYVGDGGSGKTTHMATMANLGGKVLMVNAESGIKASALKKRGIKIENIEIFPAADEVLSYVTLEAEWKRIREALSADPTSYAGVCWDPVSEIQKVFVEDEAVAAVTRANATGRDRNPFVKDRDNWNIANDQMRLLIRRFRDLPCHFAMSSLTRREQDDDGTITYQPNVTPALQNDLFGWMDIVCVTSVAPILTADGEEDEYRGLFRPHSKFRGKDRWSATPKWLVDPTFERIVQYVDGSLTVEKDPIMKAAKTRAEKAAQLSSSETAK